MRGFSTLEFQNIIHSMMALRIHLLVLLSLPLAALCRQYEVLIEPSHPELCLLFTVANGGNSTQADGENPSKIGCFDPNGNARKCIWQKKKCEAAEDRCDPDLSKERFTEQMVREIKEQLDKEHKVLAGMIIRRRIDPDSGEKALPGSTTEEWVEFDKAIDNAENNRKCLGRRGLTLDFIARDQDHCENIISLGYLIAGEDLIKDQEDELNDKLDDSSIRALGNNEHLSLAAMLRGPESLGRYLSDAFTSDGPILVIPSPKNPKPDVDKMKDPCYYKGGHTVRQFGSCCSTLNIDAIQVAIPEHLMGGASREENAKSMAAGIHQFLKAMHLI